ncbi:hypothetical protein AVEN_33216-1 [Araneus ventricosus]|uniref:RNase H type-1 domain-containing protein n=1 Tax=Araneus ventricosus TaxID=182803 RepID=A0A4Y2SBQ3_ARAVE|nr:hypothetical protein AVEN_33216-1 [Araneus ventricosus]
MARLPDHSSVFQAEVLGIKLALDYCKDIQHIKDIHIYSDSRAALQSLADPINHNSLVQKTKQAFLRTRERLSIKLHWIKAHIGYQGNERADQLAKEATLRPSLDFNIPKPTSSLKRNIRTGLIDQWNDRWFMSTNGRQTYKYIPLAGLKRKTEIPQVVHFLTNHGRFQYYFFRFRLSNTQNCSCGQIGNADHYILHCPLNSDLSGKLVFDAENPPSILETKANQAIIKQIVDRVDTSILRI